MNFLDKSQSHEYRQALANNPQSFVPTSIQQINSNSNQNKRSSQVYYS